MLTIIHEKTGTRVGIPADVEVQGADAVDAYVEAEAAKVAAGTPESEWGRLTRKGEPILPAPVEETAEVNTTPADGSVGITSDTPELEA